MAFPFALLLFWFIYKSSRTVPSNRFFLIIIIVTCLWIRFSSNLIFHIRVNYETIAYQIRLHMINYCFSNSLTQEKLFIITNSFLLIYFWPFDLKLLDSLFFFWLFWFRLDYSGRSLFTSPDSTFSLIPLSQRPRSIEFSIRYMKFMHSRWFALFNSNEILARFYCLRFAKVPK